MIHYFYGTLQVGIGQTLCSFEHVSCFFSKHIRNDSCSKKVYMSKTYKAHMST